MQKSTPLTIKRRAVTRIRLSFYLIITGVAWVPGFQVPVPVPPAGRAG